MILTFSKTTAELLSGHKSVTRRFYSERTIQNWQKAWDEGRLVHKAYNQNPRNGGVHIADIELTERPYLESLYMMPEADLEAEGGMVDTLEEFSKLVEQDLDAVALVIRFKVKCMKL